MIVLRKNYEHKSSNKTNPFQFVVVALIHILHIAQTFS
jgi:hypothetical protein